MPFILLVPANDITFYSHVSHGVRIVKNKERLLALMDKNGKIISPWVTSFNVNTGPSGTYEFYNNEKINSEISSSIPELLPGYNNGLIIFEQNNKSGLMDTLGHIKVIPEYKAIRFTGSFYYTDNSTTKARLQGVLDVNGKLVMPALYENVQYFSGPDYFTGTKQNTNEPELFILKP